jgi:hypothetical protein
MCLKKFNPLLSLSLLFFLMIFVACKSEVKEKKDSRKGQKSSLSFEERARRSVEADLKINASEKYDIQIHKAHIDRDTLEDAVILVNRKQWALEKVEKDGNSNFAKKIGFTGPYNNVFVYLAKYDKFIPTPNIGSNAEQGLDVDFEVLTTPSQKDFFVDYRIRNSMHRNYYTIRNDRVFLTFNCPVFDNIGSPNPEAYSIQHRESPIRLAKDIALYHGEISGYNPSGIENVNNYLPKEISSTGELFVFFIFDEKTMSYVTPMENVKKNTD